MTRAPTAWPALPLAEWAPMRDTVRKAPNPDAVLLDFLRSTYVAAADTAGWDRKALER